MQTASALTPTSSSQHEVLHTFGLVRSVVSALLLSSAVSLPSEQIKSSGTGDPPPMSGLRSDAVEGFL